MINSEDLAELCDQAQENPDKASELENVLIDDFGFEKVENFLRRRQKRTVEYLLFVDDETYAVSVPKGEQAIDFESLIRRKHPMQNATIGKFIDTNQNGIMFGALSFFITTFVVYYVQDFFSFKPVPDILIDFFGLTIIGGILGGIAQYEINLYRIKNKFDRELNEKYRNHTRHSDTKYDRHIVVDFLVNTGLLSPGKGYAE